MHSSENTSASVLKWPWVSSTHPRNVKRLTVWHTAGLLATDGSLLNVPAPPDHLKPHLHTPADLHAPSAESIHNQNVSMSLIVFVGSHSGCQINFSLNVFWTRQLLQSQGALHLSMLLSTFYKKSEERKSWEWINDERSFMCGWTVPLNLILQWLSYSDLSARGSYSYYASSVWLCENAI